ncbi:MAG: type II toxin-antitoxin system PemK/MazF family toxin [Patescibacteria group bacterium]
MSKDYRKWIGLKSKINNTNLPRTFHVNVGEIWWCSFGENIGIEIDGKGDEYIRPALVIKFFNKNHIWVLPLTTSNTKGRFHVQIISFSELSAVITSQLRTVSTNRLSRFISKINKDDLLTINHELINILKYETPANSGGISRPLGNNRLIVADEDTLSNPINQDNIPTTDMPHNFSPIQNHILSKLKNAKSLRYSDMKPDHIPNDLYNYHLQFLVKKGFLIKSGEGYSLSESGIKHVADPYPTNDAITSLFKINVITIVSRIIGGKIEILNQVRKSNPSYGKVGVMGGVVLKGEFIELAATRKLKQETGLDADFKLLGIERRIMYKGGEIFSDLMFPIAYANNYSGELIEDSDFGHNMWVSIDEAIKNESDAFDSIKGITTVLKAIKNKSIGKLPFFFEEVVKSDIVDREQL